MNAQQHAVDGEEEKKMACQEANQRHHKDCCSSLERKGGLRSLCELGKGGQGIVFLCTDEACKVRLACKTVRSHVHPPAQNQQEYNEDADLLGWADEDVYTAYDTKKTARRNMIRKLTAEEVHENALLRREAAVLQHLRGIPGILPLVSAFEGDDTCFHLVTPFCDGGDLHSKLNAQLAPLSHHEAAPIVASLASTLAACHARGIVHRDIKPGNILLRRVAGSNREETVIADFGLAGSITPGSRETLCDPVGTSRYQAPEVIRGQYDHRADIWSLGVTIHLLLTSTLPFTEHLPHGAPASAIQRAILHNDLQLEGLSLSLSAQDLLRRILCKDPDARLTLEELLCHPWILQNMRTMLEPTASTINSSKQTAESGATIVFPTAMEWMLSSLTHEPLYGARHTAGGFNANEGDRVPSVSKIALRVRCRRPMGRKCFRQQWANAIAKAGVA